MMVIDAWCIITYTTYVQYIMSIFVDQPETVRINICDSWPIIECFLLSWYNQKA